MARSKSKSASAEASKNNKKKAKPVTKKRVEKKKTEKKKGRKISNVKRSSNSKETPLDLWQAESVLITDLEKIGCVLYIISTSNFLAFFPVGMEFYNGV